MMPVLAIGGADWLGPAMERMIEPVASNLRVEVIPECGHFVPEEAPERLAALLDAFLPST
jgi:pimeloyl-ACP methyl ester carboxylesterase